MSSEAELLKIEKAEDWLQIRMPEIQRILDTIKDVKHDVVGDDMTNLNRLHTISSVVRERQQFVKTYLVQVINLQLETKRFLALAKQKYKDAMGKAFTDYSEIVAKAKSFEEKEMRLRQYVKEIREKEEWEEIVDQVGSLKEAVQLVYDDLSKSAMAVSLQNGVVKNQIMTGELKIQFAGFTPQGVLTENLLTSSDKAAMKRLPGDGQPRGEFDFS